MELSGNISRQDVNLKWTDKTKNGIGVIRCRFGMKKRNCGMLRMYF